MHRISSAPVKKRERKTRVHVWMDELITFYFLNGLINQFADRDSWEKLDKEKGVFDRARDK
jgi:hypothetical protein